MDLIGDMLARHLQDGHFEDVRAEQLRPRLHARFSKMRWMGGCGFFRNADRLINRFSDYPHWIRRRAGDYDVFHLVDHSYSQLLHYLPAGRTIVTCHDLDTFRCILEPEREPRPAWFRSMARRILDGFRKAAHVVAVSEATRRALLEFQLVASERITVIPNGVHPSCSPQASTKDDEFSQLTNAEAGALILLSVGSTLARKRLDVLLRVFAAVRSRQAGALLVRIGGLTPEQHQLARELNIFDSIRILPFLDRNLLAAAYRSAAVLLQTSEAEGFGLPVIEAMACGCPVVASDIEVLREVGASAAEYCQVGDIAAWSATVLRLLEERSERPSAWALRRQCGLERAEKFSWAENARQTVDIYRRIHKIGDR